jgi:murein DD-endopeptidase MepM/ murein hydrolase activator NlpD
MKVWAVRGGLIVIGLATLLTPATGMAESHSLHDRQHGVENRLESARERLAEARSRESGLSAEIDEQNVLIDGLEGRIADLGAELSELETQLAASRARLARVREQLREQTEHLRLVRRQLSIAEDRLARRLVEIYTSSEEPDVVALLLSAESLDELLDRVEFYSATVDQDTQIAADVQRLRVEVAQARARTAVLEEQQANQTEAVARQTEERRAAYASLVSERDRLAAARADRQDALASVQVQRREWEEEADALAAESERIAALIAAAPPPASGGSGGAPSSSGFVWPVQGPVVSPYGMRWGRLHAGIDIAAPAGTPVVASASGRVAYAGSMSGYGLLVIVQHAGGIATAYAHNSALAVSVGQSVGQGQQIASVGCTGHCYGDHVHFEVRVNGSPVDPMGYL